jgi:hypothetical protein
MGRAPGDGDLGTGTGFIPWMNPDDLRRSYGILHTIMSCGRRPRDSEFLQAG